MGVESTRVGGALDRDTLGGIQDSTDKEGREDKVACYVVGDRRNHESLHLDHVICYVAPCFFHVTLSLGHVIPNPCHVIPNLYHATLFHGYVVLCPSCVVLCLCHVTNYVNLCFCHVTPCSCHVIYGECSDVILHFVEAMLLIVLLISSWLISSDPGKRTINCLVSSDIGCLLRYTSECVLIDYMYMCTFVFLGLEDSFLCLPSDSYSEIQHS